MKNINKNFLFKILITFFTLFLILNIIIFYPLFFDNNSFKPGRVVIYDNDGQILTHKGNQYGYFKSYTGSLDLETEFIKELIKEEDKRFFSHFGVDLIAKIRALKTNIQNKKIISGGSTITEQYIKNRYFRNKKRTYFQKIRESYIAFFYDLIHSKKDILSHYLDSIYFGNQIYGISGAIEIYFNKNDLHSLTKKEIQKLLELIKNPSKTGGLPQKPNIDYYPHITNRILKEQKNQNEIVYHSSISKKLQDYTQNLIKKTLDELKQKNVTNGSLIAFEPQSGKIITYIGSKNFFDNNIDGQVDTIKAKRQFGSTFKPFLYLLALESGSEIDDFLIDVESKYNLGNDISFYSENYSLKEYGLIRLKKALGNSLNNAAIRLGFELGIEKVYDFYKKYGFDLPFSPDYYGLGLVLGNPSISLEELVVSYSHLLPFYGIDNDFKLTFNKKTTYKRPKIQVDPNKFLLYEILSNPDNRDISFGVNSILNTIVPLAVKTGTSSDFRDNSLVGYHPDLIVGIWIGNNDNSSMIGVTGITGAGYIYNQFIKEAYLNGFISDYKIPVPSGVSKFLYNLDINGYRQEVSYKKQKKFKSAIADDYYNESDIFVKLDEYELEKLKNLGIKISK